MCPVIKSSLHNYTFLFIMELQWARDDMSHCEKKNICFCSRSIIPYHMLFPAIIFFLTFSIKMHLVTPPLHKWIVIISFPSSSPISTISVPSSSRNDRLKKTTTDNVPIAKFNSNDPTSPVKQLDGHVAPISESNSSIAFTTEAATFALPEADTIVLLASSNNPTPSQPRWRKSAAPLIGSQGK